MTTFEPGDRVHVAGCGDGTVLGRDNYNHAMFEIRVDEPAEDQPEVVYSSVTHLLPAPRQNLNNQLADLTAKGLAVTFIPSISGIGCEVKDYDPDEDSYYGDGAGLSPSMALDAALANGGAW